MSPPPDVVILGETHGWHAKGLEAALAAAGLTAARLRFPACGFTPEGVRLGELAALPRCVIVRAIPAGTFEQVTLRLGLLHALEDLGVLVVNRARTIERCVDKAATSLALVRAGLPTPATWAVENEAQAQGIATAAAAAGDRLVVKPLFGAQGKGLRCIAGPQELPPPAELAGVYYLQRYVGREWGWRDFRVLVVDGEPVAGMVRHGTTWITNLRQGGRPEPLAVDMRQGELAVAAALAVGATYAGVDLIEDPQGALQVLEVNSMPAWRGLQSVTAQDLAACLAGAVVRRLRAPLRAVG